MDNIDYILDENLESMQKQIKDIKIDENFKVKLKNTLEENKDINNRKMPIFKNINFRKWVAVVACSLIIIGGGVFAKEIENIVLYKLSNVDKVAKEAIENGEAEYLNIEQVSNNGITIKPEYLIQKENNTYITFDVDFENSSNNLYIIGENSVLGVQKDNNENMISANWFYGNNDGKTILILKLEDLYFKNFEKINVLFKSILIKNKGAIPCNIEFEIK